MLLASYIGRPTRSQEYNRWLGTHKFTVKPDGIPGNNDYGAMSSFYLFTNVLGIYPETCTGRFIVSTPIFRSLEVRRAGETQPFLRVLAPNNGQGNDGIAKSVTVNGQQLDASSYFVDMACLQASTPCTLEFEF